MGNQNSGRRPQPTALKVLRGNPSKTRLNEHEPVAPVGPVEMPAELSKAARVIWAELAPMCVAMGTLTPVDVRAFAMLCELQATVIQASSQKDAPGFAPFVVSQDFNGADVVKIHAAVKLERETSVALRPYYALFGLDPSNRARMQVQTPESAPQSKWAGALL